MKNLTIALMFMALPVVSQAADFMELSEHAKAAVFAEEEGCGTPKYAPHELEAMQKK